MSSQLRVNKSENRSGLGTITYTDSGPIVSGIVTANSFSGDIIGDITGAVTATTGSFSGDVSIAEKIIHTGDTNTFMKFDTDTVTFETAGDERLRIRNDGRVQVKSGSAEVIAGEGASAELRLTADEGDEGADYWKFQSNHSTNNLNIATYATGAYVDKFAIDTSGNIGQGSVTPTTPNGSNADNPNNGLVFTMYGDSPAINLVSSTTTSSDWSAINFGRTGSSTNPYRAVIGYHQSADILRINAKNIIAFDTGGDINSGEALRITADGEVLIGKYAWGSNLHPNDVNKVVITGPSPSGGNPTYHNILMLEGSETSGAVDTGGALAFGGHDGSTNRNWANIWGMKENGTGNNTAGYMAFHTRSAGGNPTERLRITSVGKVHLPTANSTNTYLNIKNIGISRATTAERLAITDIGAVCYDYELDDVMVYRSAGYWSGIDNPKRRGRIRTQNLRAAINFDIGVNSSDNHLLQATVYHSLDYSSTYAISGSSQTSFRNSGGVDGGPYWNRQMSGTNVAANYIIADIGGNATTREVSASCWYKSQSNDSEGTGSGGEYGPAVALFGDTRNSVFGGFGITSRKPDFNSTSNTHNIATSAPSVVDGSWHHIVFTYDGPNADLKIYVDGTLYLTNNSVNCSSNTRYDRVGGHYNYTYTAGPHNMANVLIYDRIISADDVKGIYYARTFYRDTI